MVQSDEKTRPEFAIYFSMWKRFLRHDCVMFLPRSDTVKPSGIIGPVWIRERRQTLRQGVGGHRSPHGIGQARGRFDDNQEVGRPGDLKAERVGQAVDCGAGP